MAKTKAQVITAALVDLGALAVGVSVSSEDSTELGLRFDALVASLAQVDAVVIADTNAIPDALFQPLVDLLVQACAPAFGAARDDAKMSAASDTLRRLYRSSLTAPASVADKIIHETLLALGRLNPGDNPSTLDKAFASGLLDNLLADLLARDVVSIANQAAITAAQANDLTVYLTELCRPKFQDGKVGSLDLMRAAETQLRIKARHATSAGTTTQDEVVAQVLWQLGRVPPGGNPSTLEKVMVARRLDRILADLAARNVISIADGASIDEAHVDALSDYAAEVLAPQLSVPPRPRDPGAKREAERALRTLSRIGQGTGALLSVDRALLPRRGTFNFTTGE